MAGETQRNGSMMKVFASTKGREIATMTVAGFELPISTLA